jgi:hypothetical protein
MAYPSTGTTSYYDICQDANVNQVFHVDLGGALEVGQYLWSTQFCTPASPDNIYKLVTTDGFNTTYIVTVGDSIGTISSITECSSINAPTPTPTATLHPTVTPEPATDTPTPTPLPPDTLPPTDTPTPTPTLTLHPTITNSPTPEPTDTPTPTPLPATATPTPTTTSEPVINVYFFNSQPSGYLACDGGTNISVSLNNIDFCSTTTYTSGYFTSLGTNTFWLAYEGNYVQIFHSSSSDQATRSGSCQICDTATPVPTDTPTPEPTVTPLPATATPTPTGAPTNTPTPSPTPLPPTDTPSPSPLPATAVPTETPTPTPTPQPVVTAKYHGTTQPSGYLACSSGTDFSVSLNNVDFCSTTTYTSNFFTSLGTNSFWISYDGNYVQIFHTGSETTATRSGSCQSCNNTPATNTPTPEPTATPTPLPATATPTPTGAPTNTPTPSPSPLPATAVPTATPTPLPTDTPTPLPPTATPQPVINVYFFNSQPSGYLACNGGTQISVSLNAGTFCETTTFTSSYFTSLGTNTFWLAYEGNYLQIQHFSSANTATRSQSCQSCNNTPATNTPTPVPTDTPTPLPTDTPTPVPTDTPTPTPLPPDTLPPTDTPTPEPTATPTPLPLTSFTGCGRGNTLSGVCDDAANNRTFYSDCGPFDFAVGCYVYVDTFPNPLTGYEYVYINGATWDINNSTGQITALSSEQC